MKFLNKIIAIVAVLVITFGISFSTTSSKQHISDIKQIVKQSYIPPYNSRENMYNDALSAFLTPHIDKAIEEWYSKNPQYTGGSVDPWDIKILSFEKIPEQTSNLWFYIKVEVMPYVLAHIQTGKDQITFMLKPTGEVTVEKFQHLESYPLPKRN
jgi:hypothetical protein